METGLQYRIYSPAVVHSHKGTQASELIRHCITSISCLSSRAGSVRVQKLGLVSTNIPHFPPTLPGPEATTSLLWILSQLQH